MSVIAGSAHGHVVIPDLRAAVRHALPNVVEAKVIPIVLFVALLEVAGNRPALLAALAWALAALAYRAATRRALSGLVVLAAVTLAARTVAAVATGSMFVYFLQPMVTTVFVGVAFLVSVLLGAPLAQRLATDLLPFDEGTISHPVVRKFFVRLSLLWACTSMLNASVTLWLLVSQSTATFLVVKSFLGPATAIVTIGTMLVWLRFALARTETQIVWAGGRVAAAA
jgi:Protein of unknown function (DUF3159)